MFSFNKNTFPTQLETLFLLSPVIWLMVGVFNVPDGKSALSRLIPVVAVYCLFRFKGEWRKNLAQPGFKTFSQANAILFVLFSLQHLLDGETFSFARTLLLVQLYLTLLPWRNIKLHHLSAITALGAILTGAGSVYEVMVLHTGRAGALASNPIPYATFASVLLISCLFFLFTFNTGKRLGALYFAGVVGATTAIIFSGTRGAWLAVILTLLMLIVPLVRRATPKALLTTLVAGSLLASGSLYALGNKLEIRYQQTSAEFASIASNNMNTSIGIRLQLWQRGWSYIMQSPLLGTGTAGYLKKIEQDKNAGLITPIAAPVSGSHFHNQYIDTLVRTGALGLVVLLTWMLLPAWLLHKHKNRKLRNGALASATIVLIAGLTDVPFHHTHIIYFYSILMGIMLLKADENNVMCDT
ncbi:O-antigen ligase [Oceanisphaera litoralis]|uniref:O-antigen ligase family protein n=1 Tax=Oceanisphaera litoralis TaxID=225144 RepID=UPI00195E85E4|nr:O-antigen ligase family protein [Oceanisphaera litoralis]MBM7456308.1 O-antigen ligase [Oceanisphaera litoralis]